MYDKNEVTWVTIWEEDGNKKGIAYPHVFAHWCELFSICYVASTYGYGKGNGPKAVKICEDFREAVKWAEERCKTFYEVVSQY